MALDTYDELVASVQGHLDDTLADQIDDFIAVCESRMRRDVRFRDILKRTTISLAEDARFATLPTDFLDIKFLRLQNPDTGGPRFLTFDQITDAQMEQDSLDIKTRPRRFTIGDQVEIDTEADQAYTMDLLYYYNWTGLSESNATNEILDFASDLYLYGTLGASAPYLMHDDRVAMWLGLYDAGVQALKSMSVDAVQTGPVIARARRVPGRRRRL